MVRKIYFIIIESYIRRLIEVIEHVKKQPDRKNFGFVGIVLMLVIL